MKMNRIMYSRYFLYIITSLFILIIFNSSNVFAADYYVDMINGSDSSNGSISNPWKTFNPAKKSAGTVKPGDTVYVRKVSYQYTSQYGFTLEAGDSGSVGNPITYKAYPGETVTLSGVGTTTKAIFVVRGAEYLIFDGFNFGTAEYPKTQKTRAVVIANGSNIIIRNCYMNEIWGGIVLGVGSSGEKTPNDVYDITVSNNVFEKNQAPIYANYVDGFIISGNIFKYTMEVIKLNPHWINHTVEDVYIYGNFFYQSGWGFRKSDGTLLSGTNPGVLLTDFNYSGTGSTYISNINVYNNIFWGMADSGVRTQRSDVKIYHNVFYRGGYYDGSVLDNSVAHDGAGIVIENGVNVSEIKNNIFYDNEGSDIYVQSGSYSESNNLMGNPNFINGDPINVDPYNPNKYKIASNSPAIDQGADLSSSGVRIDYFGNSRPDGSGFDIGAHEYCSTSDCIGPAAPTNLQ